MKTDPKWVTRNCKYHGEFEQRITDIKQCPDCSGFTDHSFDMSAPAILYYLRVENPDCGILYKIGITSRKVRARHTVSDLGIFTILAEFQYGRGETAAATRQSLLKRHKEFQYKGPWRFADGTGATELFTKDVLEMDEVK